MSRPLAVVCLAAGLGKRTKVSIPKVLLPLCGRTLVGCSLDATDALQPQRTVVVVHHQKEKVEKEVSGRKGVVCVDQGKPMGTGHAVKVAMAALADFEGDVLVTYGDCPLTTSETLATLRELRENAPCSVLTAFADDPTGLGRILRDDQDRFVGIREHRDCSDEELAIEEINAGIYCFDSKALRPALEKLQHLQPDIVLTDVRMPVVTGVEVLAATSGTQVTGSESLVGLMSGSSMATAHHAGAAALPRWSTASSDSERSRHH